MGTGLTVTVIGVGRVGSAVAFALILHCSKIYLADVDKKRLEGEFRDLRHSACLINKKCIVEKGTLQDANKSDYAIICAGKARKSSKESTDSLFGNNYPIVKKICKRLKVKTLILTNPTERIADEINREVFKAPLAIPIGGMLDKARAEIDGITGGYIIDRKGHTNWGVAGEVVEFVMRKK